MEVIAFVVFIGSLVALFLTRNDQDVDSDHIRPLSVAQLIERERVQRELERGRRALARERARAKKSKVGAKAKAGTKAKPKAVPKAKPKAKR